MAKSPDYITVYLNPCFDTESFRKAWEESLGKNFTAKIQPIIEEVKKTPLVVDLPYGNLNRRKLRIRR